METQRKPHKKSLLIFFFSLSTAGLCGLFAFFFLGSTAAEEDPWESADKYWTIVSIGNYGIETGGYQYAGDNFGLAHNNKSPRYPIRRFHLPTVLNKEMYKDGGLGYEYEGGYCWECLSQQCSGRPFPIFAYREGSYRDGMSLIPIYDENLGRAVTRGFYGGNIQRVNFFYLENYSNARRPAMQIKITPIEKGSLLKSKFFWWTEGNNFKSFNYNTDFLSNNKNFMHIQLPVKIDKSVSKQQVYDDRRRRQSDDTLYKDRDVNMYEYKVEYTYYEPYTTTCLGNMSSNGVVERHNVRRYITRSLLYKIPITVTRCSNGELVYIAKRHEVARSFRGKKAIVPGTEDKVLNICGYLDDQAEGIALMYPSGENENDIADLPNPVAYHKLDTFSRRSNFGYTTMIDE